MACRPGEALAGSVPPPLAGSAAAGSAGGWSEEVKEDEAIAGPPAGGDRALGPQSLGNRALGPQSFDQQGLGLQSPREQMPGADRSMFRRFMAGRDASKTWQTMFEVPVGLFPQTEPTAHVVANEGLNWVTTFQPLNRVFFGRSIGYARMVWQPGGRLDTTEVVQWDWTEFLGFALQPWWVMSLGVGVGFMDGLIFYKDGAFKHRLEVFLPVQVGTGVRLGKTWFVGVKFAQSSYFGAGPVASAARALVGIGYNY